MTAKNSPNGTTRRQEVVVTRSFRLPVPEISRDPQTAVARNLAEVAKVAAAGGVQGIRWVPPKTSTGNP